MPSKWLRIECRSWMLSKHFESPRNLLNKSWPKFTGKGEPVRHEAIWKLIVCGWQRLKIMVLKLSTSQVYSHFSQHIDFSITLLRTCMNESRAAFYLTWRALLPSWSNLVVMRKSIQNFILYGINMVSLVNTFKQNKCELLVYIFRPLNPIGAFVFTPRS